MELTALALFLTSTPQALQALPTFSASNSHSHLAAEEQSILQQEHPVLMGTQSSPPYWLPVAA
jgi:hypothetical protein